MEEGPAEDLDVVGRGAATDRPKLRALSRDAKRPQMMRRRILRRPLPRPSRKQQLGQRLEPPRPCHRRETYQRTPMKNARIATITSVRKRMGTLTGYLQRT